MEKSVIKDLRNVVGKDHLYTSPEEVALYAYDATPFAPATRPDAVVFPGSAEEVSGVVQLANRVPFPVVPRGAGPSAPARRGAAGDKVAEVRADPGGGGPVERAGRPARRGTRKARTTSGSRGLRDPLLPRRMNRGE